jgi:hypothetical protein
MSGLPPLACCCCWDMTETLGSLTERAAATAQASRHMYCRPNPRKSHTSREDRAAGYNTRKQSASTDGQAFESTKVNSPESRGPLDTTKRFESAPSNRAAAATGLTAPACPLGVSRSALEYFLRMALQMTTPATWVVFQLRCFVFPFKRDPSSTVSYNTSGDPEVEERHRKRRYSGIQQLQERGGWIEYSEERGKGGTGEERRGQKRQIRKG